MVRGQNPQRTHEPQFLGTCSEQQQLPISSLCSSPPNCSKDERNKFVIYVPDPSLSSATYSSPDGLHADDTSTSTGIGNEGYAPGDPPEQLLPLLNYIAHNLTESWETDKLTKNTTFLGRNSSANFFRRLSAIHIYDLLPLDISIESAFGLTNRTTLHPFGSLWVTVHVTLGDVLQALPGLETCTRYRSETNAFLLITN